MLESSRLRDLNLILTRDVLTDPRQRVQIGKLTTANVLVVGTVTDIGDEIEIDARFLEVATGRTVSSTFTSVAKSKSVDSLLNRRCVEYGTPKEIPPEKIQGRVVDERYEIRNDRTVKDLKTGLVWQREDDGIKKNQNDAVAYCQNLNLAGYTDWKLPDRGRLVSLVTSSRQKGYYIHAESFPDVSKYEHSFYWSSSAKSEKTAWYVYFCHGRESDWKGKSSNMFVRCVRSD